MKRLSESIFNAGIERNQGNEIKQEDVIQQDPQHWWRYIDLDNPKKYPSSELKALDIIYELVINRIKKTLDVKDIIPVVDIYFKNEVWDLVITHITPFGSSTYKMEVHGSYSPWYEPFSKLLINQKRSIRQRLEEKQFYVYKYNCSRTEYILREEPEYKGEKGIKLI